MKPEFYEFISDHLNFGRPKVRRNLLFPTQIFLTEGLDSEIIELSIYDALVCGVFVTLWMFFQMR